MGEILSSASVDVGEHTKAGALRHQLAELGATELVHVLRGLPQHYANATPQPTHGASYGQYWVCQP